MVYSYSLKAITAITVGALLIIMTIQGVTPPEWLVGVAMWIFGIVWGYEATRKYRNGGTKEE